METINDSRWICKICVKKYSSQHSLCNHNRKFHKSNNIVDSNKNNTIIKLEKTIEDLKKQLSKDLQCEYCNKTFTLKSSKIRHNKICKEKDKEPSQKISIINNNNNTIINNIIIQVNKNDYKTYDFNSKKDKTIIPIILDDDTKIKLCSEPHYNLIPKLVEIVYCGKYIQFRNVYITNLTNKIIYVYKNGNFIADDKEDVLNILFENNYCNLDNIYEDVKCMENINPDIMDKINKNYKKFIEKYEADDVKYSKYKNFKEFNKNKISFLLYNNRHKIKCALISETELTEDEIQMMVYEKEELMEEI